MQAAHEHCEARARLAKHVTERMQLAETESLIMTGRVNPTQVHIRSIIEKLQDQYEQENRWRQEYMGEFSLPAELPAGFVPVESVRDDLLAEDSLRTLSKMVGDSAVAKMELAQCKKTEEQMLGIQPKVPLSALPKVGPEPDLPSGPGSERIQAMARAYRLATGKHPTAKEIQKWIGSKY